MGLEANSVHLNSSSREISRFKINDDLGGPFLEELYALQTAYVQSYNVPAHGVRSVECRGNKMAALDTQYSVWVPTDVSTRLQVLGGVSCRHE